MDWEDDCDEYFQESNAMKREQVLQQLRCVIDPDILSDIITCNFLRNLNIEGGSVTFTLELTTPACPMKSFFISECTKYLKQLPWVESVSIDFTAARRLHREGTSQGTEGVSNFIAVSSCKGGVGKSTVAVNLAYELNEMGASVGICDLDIYGPSLHVLVPLLVDGERPKIYFDDYVGNPETVRDVENSTRFLLPIEHKGVKLMSAGYILKETQFTGFRGALASSLVNQLLHNTKWGELDYLILDLPPGTGDVIIELIESLPLKDAIVITNSSPLAQVDVLRGIEFFTRFDVNILGVVDNMSAPPLTSAYHDDDFIESTSDIDHPVILPYPTTKIPLCRELQKTQFCKKNCSQQLYPFSVAYEGNPSNPAKAALRSLASEMIREHSKFAVAKLRKPLVAQSSNGDIEFNIPTRDNLTAVIVRTPRDLRVRCACDICRTNDRNALKRSVPLNITILAIRNYSTFGTVLQFSDGHLALIKHRDLLSDIQISSSCNNALDDW